LAEAEHGEGAALEVVGLPALVEARLRVVEGGVDQPLPVPLRRVFSERSAAGSPTRTPSRIEIRFSARERRGKAAPPARTGGFT
jgi:hypothetical protein